MKTSTRTRSLLAGLAVAAAITLGAAAPATAAPTSPAASSGTHSVVAAKTTIYTKWYQGNSVRASFGTNMAKAQCLSWKAHYEVVLGYTVTANCQIKYFDGSYWYFFQYRG